MDCKAVTALEYSANGCDDIGITYYLKYICPYCGQESCESGLEGYGAEYDSSLFYGTKSRCQHCGQISYVENPNR